MTRPNCRHILVNSSCHGLSTCSLLYKCRVHDALLFLKIIREFGLYLPTLLWNPVSKMIFTLFNRCKLKSVLRGILSHVLTFLFLNTDFTALVREFRYIEPVVKQRQGNTKFPREKKQLTLCKEDMNVAVVHARRPTSVLDLI